MRKKEQKLWDTFARHAPAALDLQRVENLVGAGMPDVYVGGTGCWVELKAPNVPARETTRLLGTEGLNVDQINWHLKAARSGRVNTFVLVRDSSSRLYLVPGNFAATMNDLPADELDSYSLASTWERIIEVLSQ